MGKLHNFANKLSQQLHHWIETGNRLNHSRSVISDSGLSHSGQRKGKPHPVQILVKYWRRIGSATVQLLRRK